MIAAGLTGFGTGLSLILPIGAQNALVLRQGLLRAHVFWVCLVCSFSDAALIVAGVQGFGAITTRFPAFVTVLTWGGAAFLLVYGFLRFVSAYKGSVGLEPGQTTQSLRSAILTCLAFTWLNPHVYLDTLGLIGAISTNFDGPFRTSFMLGAVVASFTFFFALGYGARALAPVITSPRAWVFIDIAIGTLMWTLAVGLLVSQH